MHYLNDFLFVGPAGSGQCSALLSEFQELCNDLGVPLVEEKTEGPSTKLTFLGIELDTVAQTSGIPEDKLNDLKERVVTFSSKCKVSLLELQQLVGHLNFACKVVAPGKAFLHRLCEAMKGLKHPHYHLRLSRCMRDDLLV